jgi:hypothetical protein
LALSATGRRSARYAWSAGIGRHRPLSV